MRQMATITPRNFVSYLIFAIASLVGILATSVALADAPPAGSTVPCGTTEQCAATDSSCPSAEGWIVLPPPKWVKCCKPSAGNPQTYYWYWLKLTVFNKVPPGQDLRCYRWTAYVQGEPCNPSWPCVDDIVPGAG